MSKIPVTILSGFLGAGKTTLVNKILGTDHGFKIALIENEFGETGIDNDLVKNIDDVLVEMNNGCLCCSVRGDMVRILMELLDSKKNFDYILIEATGMANPAKIAEAFVGDSPLAEHFELDSVVTIVDTFHYDKNEKRDDGDFREQISFADKIIMNKVDLCSFEQRQMTREKVMLLNPHSEIQETSHCDIEVSEIINGKFFDMGKVEELLSTNHVHNHHDHHDHDHGDHHHHHDHDHEQTVRTVSIEVEGVVKPNLFENFLNYLMTFNPDAIYRSKGLLNFPGMDEKIIFQGVYSSFDFDKGKSWGEGTRINKIVFIGTELNKEAIEKGFMNCLMSEEEHQVFLQEIAKIKENS